MDYSRSVSERARRGMRAAQSGADEQSIQSEMEDDLSQKRQEDVGDFRSRKAKASALSAAQKADLKNNMFEAIASSAVTAGKSIDKFPGKQEIAPVQDAVNIKADAPDSSSILNPAARVQLADKSAVARPDIGTKASVDRSSLSRKEMRKFRRGAGGKGGTLTEEEQALFADEEVASPYAKPGSLYGK